MAATAADQNTEVVITLGSLAFMDENRLAGLRTAKTTFANPQQFDRLARYHGLKSEWLLKASTDTWMSAPFANWSLDTQLAALPCPILVLHGDQDEYGSLAHPQRIRDRAGAGSEMFIISGGGHILHRDSQSEVIQRISAFLKRL
ncbi:hypothetical protein ABENE_11330 [Asticcacaulis benevestitus DSM 16100 = ATCC BAA-896]|uniref:AB hydrolase-1 domain-containing protein n=2 Tax=Asticcacaulis TaxID=76890 RepID=V4PRU5_9CAUL|nr:hypothetical protein ABENE_11330 [Asticcacaulis benevestitus DSM 16100 = ATCC BAA-896]